MRTQRGFFDLFKDAKGDLLPKKRSRASLFENQPSIVSSERRLSMDERDISQDMLNSRDLRPL
jgi:hypothetical protein